jgi:hypothetical protein
LEIILAKPHGRKRHEIQNIVLIKPENKVACRNTVGALDWSEFMIASSKRKEDVPAIIEISAVIVPNRPKSAGEKKPVITKEVANVIICAIIVPIKMIFDRLINLEFRIFFVARLGIIYPNYLMSCLSLNF